MNANTPFPMAARLYLLAMGLLFSAAAAAVPQIQHWTTENGARVYFVPAHELPMVDIRVVFDAGAAKDGERPGLAQLTNSLLEEGAGHMDGNAIARRFDELGAHFSTDSLRDMALLELRTLTDEPVLRDAVSTMALILEAPTFPEDALQRERNRMLVALRQQQQSPSDIASKAFFSAVYGLHPYANPPGGTEESLRTMNRAEVEGFFHRYYCGRNAVVAIVGDLNRGQAQELAENVVGGLATGERASAPPPVQALTEGRSVHEDYPSTQTHVLMGAPVMSRDDPDYFPLYVGNHILGGSGLVSRISEEVREKRALSYSAYSYFAPMHAAGPFILGLQTRNKKTDEALRVLRATLDAFVRNGPTDTELEAAKKNLTGGFPLQLDSNKDIVSYLAMIGFYDLPLNYLDTYTARIRAVTAAQVRDAFQRRVHPQRMVTVTVGPKE